MAHAQKKSFNNPFGHVPAQEDEPLTQSDNAWSSQTIDLNLSESVPIGGGQEKFQSNQVFPSTQPSQSSSFFSQFSQQPQQDLQGTINWQEVGRQPQSPTFSPGQGGQNAIGELDEPPLLEDLGINLELIKQRTISVLTMKGCKQEFAVHSDMMGPVLLGFILGILLLLNGKVHFGYIYGFGISGIVSLYIILNLLSQEKQIPLYNVLSILGYCLLPIVLLGAITLILKIIGLKFLVNVFAVVAVAWSTYTASQFFEEVLQLDHQKSLAAYPTLLFYSTFVLITIF